MSVLMPALLIEGTPYYNYAHAALELKVLSEDVKLRVASKDPQWKRWMRLTDEPIRRFQHIVKFDGKVYRSLQTVMDVTGLTRNQLVSSSMRGRVERFNITQLEFDRRTMYLVILGKRYESLQEAKRKIGSSFAFLRGLLYMRKDPMAHAMSRETNQEIFLTYDISRERYENPLTFKEVCND